MYAHIPFDTVPSPGLAAADLARFRALMLPNLQAVSDAEAGVLRDFVAGGGTVVITGPAPTALDQWGTPRSEYALADVLGFRKADPLPASKDNHFGKGTCRYVKDLPGLGFLSNSDKAGAERLLGPVRAAAPPAVTLAGDERIHLELSRLGDDTIVQLVNFTHFADVPRAFTITPTTCTVTLTVPAGKKREGRHGQLPRRRFPRTAAGALDGLRRSGVRDGDGRAVRDAGRHHGLIRTAGRGRATGRTAGPRPPGGTRRRSTSRRATSWGAPS
ncbi:hypothetical protein GCM10020000_72170 [Streptomyces olivoverticillatus]